MMPIPAIHRSSTISCLLAETAQLFFGRPWHLPAVCAEVGPVSGMGLLNRRQCRGLEEAFAGHGKTQPIVQEVERVEDHENEFGGSEEQGWRVEKL
jgi:hypothetical protein